MSERKRYHKDNAPTDDIITLINLVRQNPALYNYKLQPNQRRRPDILSGWEEVSQQMGNKYSVQEVRRKWKNLRDTYHQYRRRSRKCIDGRLSKWRYAKHLDFLSKVYQPKLKAQRNALAQMMHTKKEATDDDDLDDDDVDDGVQHDIEHDDHDPDQDDHEHVVDDDEHSDGTPLSSTHHASSSHIALVGETFILTAYEESVTDDTVTTHHHGHQTQQQQHHHAQHHQHHSQQQQQHHHQQQHHQQQQHHHHHHHHHHQTQHDGSISSIELSQITHDDDDVDDDDVVDDELQDDVEDDVVDHDGQVVDIVKHELDEDGATGAEVDYEEVCLYEEATAGHCEMGVDGGSDVTDSKGFHYIDADDFCIEDMETEPEPETETVTETRTTTVTVPLRATQHHTTHATHHFATTTATAPTNSVLSGGNTGVITADTKLKNFTLVTTTAPGVGVGVGAGVAAASAAVTATTINRHEASVASTQHQHQQQQLTLVDVTEATSTSVTISSTPTVALNAATVGGNVVTTTLPLGTTVTTTATPGALCNAATAAAATYAGTVVAAATTTPAGATVVTPATGTTILQLPSLSCATNNSSSTNHNHNHSHNNSSSSSSSCSVAATQVVATSSTNLIKDDDQQQQQQQQQPQQQQQQQQQQQFSPEFITRDELDLFFDFLKKKMQSFSKTQITHIQMEFLNCVRRQEVAANHQYANEKLKLENS